MVIFQAPGGNPGYNQFDSLESAVEFVEQLRNERDVTNARIFALEEVKFEMRPYFKVELQALTTGSGGSAAESSSASPSPAAPSQPAPSQSAPSQPAPSAPSAPAAPEPPAPSAPPAPQPPAPSAPPSAAPAPPAAPQPGQEQGDSGDSDQPARRGLFGR